MLLPYSLTSPGFRTEYNQKCLGLIGIMARRDRFSHAGRVCLVFLGLVVSLVALVTLGMDLAFNVYAVPLKQAFNFSQTQVELVSGCGVVGLGLSLVDSFLYAGLGHALWCFVLWLVTTISVFSMWISVVYKDVLQHWPFIICVTQVVMCGSEINGLTRLVDNLVRSFPAQYTGKLVGVGVAACSFAKIFYGEILEHFFVDDLAGFFLTAAIVQSVFLGLGFLIHCVQDDGRLAMHAHEDDKEADCSSALCSHDNSSQPMDIDKLQPDGNVIAMVKSSQFHLLFWPSIIMYSIMYTYMINVTAIAHALNIQHSVNLVYLLSVTIGAGRVISGVVFDKFRTRTCGFFLVLFGSLSAAFALFLVVLGCTETILYVVAFLIGVALSIGLTIPCTMLTAQFGQDRLSFVIGCFLCLAAGFGLLFQFFLGALYDRFLSADNFCYGPSCFYLSSTVMFIVTVLVICVHVFNFVRYRCEKTL